MMCNGMRSAIGRAGLIFLALGVCACDIDRTEEGELPDVTASYREGEMPEYEVRKTQEGRMPDLDVDVEGGALPSYDVDTPEVEVRTRQERIEVPDVDVDVHTEERTITVPEVDVDMPDDDDRR